MNDIHDHLWEFLFAKRSVAALKEWLQEANRILHRNGLEPQTDALEAQRLLKTINRHYAFFL
jgi:hypothetical protein